MCLVSNDDECYCGNVVVLGLVIIWVGIKGEYRVEHLMYLSPPDGGGGPGVVADSGLPQDI